MKRIALALLAALSLAACGGSDGPTTPPPPTLTAGGTYVGSVGTQVLTMTLIENAGVVNGTGTLTNTPTGTRAQTITGTWVTPRLTLTLSSGSAQPVALSGTVTTTQFTGTLTGSGFTGEPITMNRQ